MTSTTQTPRDYFTEKWDKTSMSQKLIAHNYKVYNKNFDYQRCFGSKVVKEGCWEWVIQFSKDSIGFNTEDQIGIIEGHAKHGDKELPLIVSLCAYYGESFICSFIDKNEEPIIENIGAIKYDSIRIRLNLTKNTVSFYQHRKNKTDIFLGEETNLPKVKHGWKLFGVLHTNKSHLKIIKSEATPENTAEVKETEVDDEDESSECYQKLYPRSLHTFLDECLECAENYQNKTYIHDVVDINKLEQIRKEVTNAKERYRKISETFELLSKQHDQFLKETAVPMLPTSWKDWKLADFCDWMSKLENGKFREASERVKLRWKEKNFTGLILKGLEENDLLKFGIASKSDRVHIFKHIVTLREDDDEN